MRDQVAALRDSAEATAQGRGDERWLRLVGATRRATGWLLVDVGLRLAVPRGAANRRMVGGQR